MRTLAATGILLLREGPLCTKQSLLTNASWTNIRTRLYAYNQIGAMPDRLGRTAEASPDVRNGDPHAIRGARRTTSRYGRWAACCSHAWARRGINYLDRASRTAAIPRCYCGMNRARLHIRDSRGHMRGLGACRRGASRSSPKQTALWPFDTVRSHSGRSLQSRRAPKQIETFQAALRLAGHRDHAEEDARFRRCRDDKPASRSCRI